MFVLFILKTNFGRLYYRIWPILILMYLVYSCMKLTNHKKIFFEGQYFGRILLVAQKIVSKKH